MKITKAKIKRELEKRGWDLDHHRDRSVIQFLIEDIHNIIDAELKAHKGISIK